MEPPPHVRVQIEPEILLNAITCLEYPELIDQYQNICHINTIKSVSSNDDHKFVYRPVTNSSERVKISSNAQKRNIIVLKVKKNSIGAIQTASLAGIVQKCHVFRELFDFTAESEYESRLHQNLKFASEDFDENKIDYISKLISESEIDLNSFCIPPYKFSHINLPLSSRDIRSNLRVTQKDESMNQERSMSISFNEPTIPVKPTDECVFKAKNVPQAHIEAVAKIFDERPIVSKLYIQQKIKDPLIIANLRQILPLLAYHWKNGPWHLLWTKYGIDPRTDPKYRFYQSIELRNKMFAKELKRGKSMASKSQEESRIKLIESGNFCFDGENLILSYLTYQYLDLTYRPLQEIVNYHGDIRSSVSEKEGWYPDGTSKKLRDIMKQRWFELLRNMDLSSLPQNKLEEIFELTTPGTSGSAIGADWNSLSKLSENMGGLLELDDDQIDYDDDDSDYEIFEY